MARGFIRARVTDVNGGPAPRTRSGNQDGHGRGVERAGMVSPSSDSISSPLSTAAVLWTNVAEFCHRCMKEGTGIPRQFGDQRNFTTQSPTGAAKFAIESLAPSMTYRPLTGFLSLRQAILVSRASLHGNAWRPNFVHRHAQWRPWVRFTRPQKRSKTPAHRSLTIEPLRNACTKCTKPPTPPKAAAAANPMRYW